MRRDGKQGETACSFAERYLEDSAVLEVIEFHDEAYNSWCVGKHKRHWNAAQERASLLIERLGANMTLYLRFLRCDNETGSKQPDSVRWFVERVQERGIEIPPDLAED